MTRAINSRYLATQVISKGIRALFTGNPYAEVVGQAIAGYYNVQTEPITELVLKRRMATILDGQVKNGRLTEDQEIDYYNYVNQIFSSDVDNSDEMLMSIDKYTRQKLAEKAILKNAQISRENPDYDLVNQLNKEMDEIADLDITGQANQVISVYEDFDTKEKLYSQMAHDQIRMGLPSMDKALQGGLARGEVGMIAASTGSGKSSVLVAYSVNYAMHGKNVLYISLEEKASRMLMRFDRSTLNMTTKDIIEKYQDPETGKTEINVNENFKNKSHKIYQAMMKNPRFGKLYFYRNSPQVVTVDRVTQIIRSTERANNIKLDAVILDYPDLLLNPDASANESQDGSLMMQRLRRMAQQTEVVLWVAAQLNRDSGNQMRKTTESIQGSYRQRNDVEFIATINRTPIEYSHGYTRLGIDKFRNSEGNMDDTLYFKYDPTTMRLSEETDEEKLEHIDLINQYEDGIKDQNRSKYQKDKSSYADKQRERATKINESLSN